MGDDTHAAETNADADAPVSEPPTAAVETSAQATEKQ